MKPAGRHAIADAATDAEPRPCAATPSRKSCGTCSVDTGLILLAWPAWPKAVHAGDADFLHRVAGRLQISRGSNFSGDSANTLRIAPVIASRLSVSTLILRTPCLMPR